MTTHKRPDAVKRSSILFSSMSSEISSNPEVEEEVETYFLQPTSSPYNITEKVQQANFDLFNSTPQLLSRSTKVKFRDELLSFEPDLTDDDVNSIESDRVEDFPRDDENCIKETATFSTIVVSDIEEESEEEVEELLSEEAEATNTECELSTQRLEMVKEPIVKQEQTSASTKPATKKRQMKSCQRLQQVNCKQHCLERLDMNLSMLIKKLEIKEKPLLGLPPLQLYQRKCCDDVRLSSSDRPPLPNYNGHRSEYGLSSRQLKNKQRHLALMRQKEITRKKLIDEYRALKIRQNEEVFCQWMREVSKRKQGGCKKKKLDSIKMISEKVTRPQTASNFIPKVHVKHAKRPFTSQSCVYIQLSPNMLEKGVHIGDLLVTNSKELNKKFQILSV